MNEASKNVLICRERGGREEKPGLRNGEARLLF
jgi:hypothetical protein